MSALYSLFKAWAFRQDPEWIHEKTLQLCSRFPALAYFWGGGEGEDEGKKFSLSVGSLRFPFPVGLAAGLDKNGKCIPFFQRLLFGAVEVGTVTPLPQEGNPRPRLFRYRKEEALLNRMGFNNQGAQEVWENIHSARGQRNPEKPLGVNLGKNRFTPPERAPLDYRTLYEKFAGVADYLVINISSPNTPGLRDLQDPVFLSELLTTLGEVRQKQMRPLFLKLSPDLDLKTIQALTRVALDFSLAGILATNTTLDPAWGEGGLSGRPLREKSTLVRHHLLELTRGCTNFHIIGVGGISSFEDIWEFWKRGGRIVQIYSAFIFQGPAFLTSVRSGILQKMAQMGCSTLQELLDHSHSKNF